MPDAPVARNARVDILLAGSAGSAVVSTCSLVRDGELAIVIDPGISPSQAAILDPLAALDLTATDVTDVVMGHGTAFEPSPSTPR